LRLGGLADHTDLLAVGPHETCDDDRDYRVAHKLGDGLLDVSRDLNGCLALGHELVDERRRYLAVWPDGNAHRELRIAPDYDVEVVTRADDVVVVGGCRCNGSGRKLRRIAGTPDKPG